MGSSQEEFCWVYITVSSKDEARHIGRILVKKSIAACINLLENMTSIYKWEGKIVEDSEVVMIAKTQKGLMKELIETVKANHSFECPCIVELPIQSGNKKYLQWIENETKEKN